MEVCKIVEGQRYSKRLNERQITALLKVTCQRPQEMEKDIMQLASECEVSRGIVRSIQKPLTKNLSTLRQ
ncbi:hypothetical protein MKX03_026055 [Papaver bracteatum]|nr:hypothetical protein MKX03_026055 [Papaver bracteatum]